jgi:ABC-2 type transport system permease protein
VLGLVTLGPPLLLLVGLTIADNGPASVGDFLLVLLRVVVSGVVISAAYTALSLAASSLTERRAVASAGIILMLLSTSAAAQTLVERAGANERVLLFDLFFVPFELVQRVYGVPGTKPGVDTAAFIAAELVWTIGAASLLWWRYRKLTITR